MIEGINLAALEGWMDAQGVGTGPIAEARLLSGGTQNILMRFRRGDAAYVLRRPPPVPRANSNDTMRREARVLAGSRPSMRCNLGCGHRAAWSGGLGCNL